MSRTSLSTVPIPLAPGVLLLSFLVFAVLEGTRAWPWDPKVKTSNGWVEGKEEDGVMVYHSIPYAQPPVGRLRFRPPQYPAEPWEGTKDVKGQPSICPQIKVTSLVHLGNEDCLYVHVYVPATAKHSEKPLPVLFWIFGGGYSLGDGYEFGFYDGKRLAANTNSIVVAANYRVGPFGFLSHDALQREGKGTTGNMGVQDQQAALLWTQDNIAAFGGDQNRVTIFGESAGAFSVCWHLVSPRSRGLFHRAIAESGTCDAGQFFIPAAKQNVFGDEYAAAMGCNSSDYPQDDAGFLSCLRSKKTEEVMNGILSWFGPDWPSPHVSTDLAAMERVQGIRGYVDDLVSKHGISGPVARSLVDNLPALAPIMPWGPVIDNTEAGLLDLPLNILREGKGNYVPTIFGSNKNEGSIFVPMAAIIVKGGGFPLNDKSLNATFMHFFLNNATLVEEVLKLYPAGDFDDSDDERAAMVLRDCFFACPMRRAARAIDANGESAFLYHFTYPIHWVEGGLLGDYHCSELAFVWGNPWPAIVHAFNSKDRTMSDSFQRFWGNMAHHGTPNGNLSDATAAAAAGRVWWPRHNSSDDMSIVMDVPVSQQQHLLEDKCAFWDANMQN